MPAQAAPELVQQLVPAAVVTTAQARVKATAPLDALELALEAVAQVVPLLVREDALRHAQENALQDVQQLVRMVASRGAKALAKRVVELVTIPVMVDVWEVAIIYVLKRLFSNLLRIWNEIN